MNESDSLALFALKTARLQTRNQIEQALILSIWHLRKKKRPAKFGRSCAGMPLLYRVNIGTYSSLAPVREPNKG